MMKQWIVSCSLACSLLCATAAQASDGADALANGVGNWKCSPQDSNAQSDGFAVISTERMPGDWFVSWVLAFHDGKSEKKVMKVRYDEARKNYVLFIFGADGAYGYGVADAVADHSLAFKGEMYAVDGTNTKFTKTFTGSNDGSYSVTWAPEGGEAVTAKCVK